MRNYFLDNDGVLKGYTECDGDLANCRCPESTTDRSDCASMPCMETCAKFELDKVNQEPHEPYYLATLHCCDRTIRLDKVEKEEKP